jgi:hypothetical protein
VRSCLQNPHPHACHPLRTIRLAALHRLLTYCIFTDFFFENALFVSGCTPIRYMLIAYILRMLWENLNNSPSHVNDGRHPDGACDIIFGNVCLARRPILLPHHALITTAQLRRIDSL